MALFGRRPQEPAVTHLVEVECPVTGRSRMFSGTDPQRVEDEAHEWLEAAFGGSYEAPDREVAWE